MPETRSLTAELQRKPYYVFRPPQDDEERGVECAPGVCCFVRIPPPYHEDYHLQKREGRIYEVGRVLDAEELRNPDMLGLISEFFRRNPNTQDTIEVEEETLFCAESERTIIEEENKQNE